MYLILLCLLSFYSRCLGITPPCPPKSEYSPCSCTEEKYLTVVECQIGSLSKLKTVIKKTLDFNVSFSFYKTKFGDMPSDLFEGHQSVYLYFLESEIGSFGDTPFAGLENSLEILDIYDSVNKSTDLKAFKLSHLKKLKKFYFNENDIVRLGNDWFENGPETLEELNLDSTKIEELGDTAFSSLRNIEKILLKGNSLKKVSRSMFPNPANKLSKLDISSNGIEELPLDMFEGFPALTYIQLEGNNLKTLSENIWSPVWNQLVSVFVDHMKEFVCDEKLKWIYKQELPKKHFRGTCRGSNKLTERKLAKLTLADFD